MPDDEVEKAEGSKEKKVEEDIFVGLTDFNEVVKTHCALELGYEGQFIFAQESHQEDKTSKEKFQFPICVFKSG